MVLALDVSALALGRHDGLARGHLEAEPGAADADVIVAEQAHVVDVAPPVECLALLVAQLDALRLLFVLADGAEHLDFDVRE